MSTEAPPPVEPDLLDLGSGPSDRRVRRTITGLVIVGLAVVVGLVGYQLWPRPPAPLTQQELQGVYAGMVRSDGSNDAVELTTTMADGDTEVVPAECRPLVAMAENRYPEGARGGMSTYWSEPQAIAMTTFRFDDHTAAEAASATVAGALEACHDRELHTGGGLSLAGEVSPVEAGPIVDTDQIAYVVGAGGRGTDRSTLFAFRVLTYSNTVTLLYRYDPSGQVYSPLNEDRLGGSLVTQMKSVQDLRTSTTR